MNNLYGNKFIEKQRKSGYKSTIYAMAEIIDNSVDAGASEISIVIKTKESFSGTRKSIAISEMLFLDNGKGMTHDVINKCLTFSEGEGRSDNRIGAFGVGLPNSSISVCRRAEVYSMDSSDKWNHVFLDLDDQNERDEPGYDSSINKKPSLTGPIQIKEDCRTIIKWKNIDLIDTSNTEILIRRANKLLGRIYRYKIGNGLSISISSYLEGNNNYTHNPIDIIPYDPLFIMESKNHITPLIWKAATHQDPKGRHKILGDKPEFNSAYHYKKFIDGCEENKTNKPIFQKHDDYWDIPYTFQVGEKKYVWRIRASFAYRGIRTPGIGPGGTTDIGREIGKKMTGDRNDKINSANIFFMRGEREIDYGHYGLYKVTDEKQRWWSIEIHFDQNLDELMGVSNVKQSVEFRAVQSQEIEDIDAHEDLAIGTQREILWQRMSQTITKAIKSMMKEINHYAKDFINLEESLLAEKDNDRTPIQQAESAVFEVIPKGEAWTDIEKKEVTDFLKSKFMHLPLDVVRNQVNIYASGLTKTIVLYAPTENGHLFELKEKRGKLITLINTEHIYYTNIIKPLKANRYLKEFAISIEMLISSFALEMDNLIDDNSEKYEQPLNKHLMLLTDRLSEFINDSHIKINTKYWEEKLANINENDTNE